MVIDFHTHIFPKAIRENREAYFASEPAFKLLYGLPGSKLIGAQEIVAAMDRQGVDKSVIFGFPWKNSQTFIKHNDYVLEAVARYPRRLIGLCCLDPFSRDAEQKLCDAWKEGFPVLASLLFINQASMVKLWKNWPP